MVKSGKDLYSLRVSPSGENYRQIKWWNVRVTPKQSSASKRVTDRGGTGSGATPSIGMNVYLILRQSTLSINALPPPPSTQMRRRLYTALSRHWSYVSFLSCIQSCVILPLHIQQSFPVPRHLHARSGCPKESFYLFLACNKIMQEDRKCYVLLFGVQ